MFKKRNKHFDGEDWDVVVKSDKRQAASQEDIEDIEAKREHTRLSSEAQRKRKKQLTALCIGCGVFVAVFAIVFILLANLLNTPTVYKGITLNGQSVSGMSQEELQDYIYTRYVMPLGDAQVVLEIDAQRKTYDAKSFLKTPDVLALSNEIYNTGRKGNLFARLFRIFELRENTKDFTVSYAVQPEKMEEILAMTESQQYITKLEPSYEIDEEQNRIVFTYGRDGLEINEESLKDTFDAFEEQLCSVFAANETKPGGTYTVKAEPKKTEFRRILKVNILNELKLGSKDATIKKTSPKDYEILPQVVGKAIDETLLDEVLARVNAGTEREETQEVFELPDDVVVYTEEFYREVLFRDVLGVGTNENPVDDNGMGILDASEKRAQNIQLVVEALNGIILLPGEEFDFREILAGIPNADFVEAFESYLGFEEAVLGGGVSQVSSALYSAACLADLSVSEIYHYTYMPNFGTIGFDAYMTLSGEENLKFVNTYAFPIRIVASYQNRQIKVEIAGTFYRESDFADIPEDKIPVTIQPESLKQLSAEIVSRVNFKVVEVQNSNLPEGAVLVEGITGYIVDLFLTTTVDETETKRPLAQVTYKVRDQQEVAGGAGN